MGTVTLRGIPELRHAIQRYGVVAEKEVVAGLRRAARYGATAVLRTSAKTDPRPKAAGTFERSWLVVPLKDGAAVTNSAKHSVFVEAGRRPGKAPPLDAIMEWILQKRFVSRRRIESKSQGRKTRAVRARHKRIAFLIQRKIKLKGSTGRWVLRRTMPAIAKRAALETRRAFAKIAKDPPR